MRVAGPNALAQLVARRDLAGPLDQDRQHACRLGLQPDGQAAAGQFTRDRIELEIAETGACHWVTSRDNRALEFVTSDHSCSQAATV